VGRRSVAAVSNGSRPHNKLTRQGMNPSVSGREVPARPLAAQVQKLVMQASTPEHLRVSTLKSALKNSKEAGPKNVKNTPTEATDRKERLFREEERTRDEDRVKKTPAVCDELRSGGYQEEVSREVSVERNRDGFALRAKTVSRISPSNPVGRLDRDADSEDGARACTIRKKIASGQCRLGVRVYLEKKNANSSGGVR